MRDFKKLLIWGKGMVIVNEVYKATAFLPEVERFYVHKSQEALFLDQRILLKEAQRKVNRRIDTLLRYHWDQLLNLKLTC